MRVGGSEGHVLFSSQMNKKRKGEKREGRKEETKHFLLLYIYNHIYIIYMRFNMLYALSSIKYT